MKTVIGSDANYRDISIARALFIGHRFADAAAALERVAETDDGFVVVCDRLIMVYLAQLGVDGISQSDFSYIESLIYALLDRRAKLSSEYDFPSENTLGAEATTEPDVFFKSIPRRPPWVMAGAVLPRLTLGFQTLGNSVPTERPFTPHIDTNPGDTPEQLLVSVFLDHESFRIGESGQLIGASVGSTVRVQLGQSDHFEPIGTTTASFTVQQKTPRIKFPDFHVRLKENAAAATGQPYFAAFFTVNDQPAGSVGLKVDLSGKPVDVVTAKAINLVSKETEIADLVVSIAQIGDRDYCCFVASHFFEDVYPDKTGTWTLGDSSKAIVSGFMERFVTDTKPAQLIAELKGVGKLLFNAAPEVFKKAFWHLDGLGKAVQTIAILSDEPYVPWELMVPTQGPNGKESTLPLGANFAMGRWIHDTATPALSLAISDSIVIAPGYGTNQLLPQSGAEAVAVTAVFPGRIVTPAGFEDVAAALTGGSSLLHFICHGDDKGDDGQVLMLDDSDELSEGGLGGIDGVRAAFAKNPPVIFLNACKVGRGNPSLVGSRSFASQFIQLGAKAVIAPLWSVDDTIAREVALAFYSSLLTEPNRRIADIFREIRKKAYETGKDTYAAYCFFGNPLATFSV